MNAPIPVDDERLKELSLRVALPPAAKKED